jgi:O-antigen ligase
MRVTVSGVAFALFFAVAPAASAGGAMGLPVLMCLAAALALRPSHLRQVIESKPIALWLLLGFWAWVLATSAWSAQPGFAQAGKLAVLAPLGLVFVAAAGAESNRRLVQAFGVAAFAVLVALMTVEALWDLPLNRAANPDIPPSEVVRNVNRGAAVVLAMTWGAAAGLIANGRSGLARAVLAASAILALPFGLWANLVAFVIALIVFAVAFGAPRFALLSVSGGLSLWMLVAPFATPLILASPRLVDALPLSWAARVGIWDYVCARILEQPWIGHGLDASRAVTDRIQVRELDMRGIPLHPHSASLQIWYETGAVGAALAAAALLAGGWTLSRVFADNRPAAAGAAATMAALGVIANISFGIWQEWWLATMFIAAALVAALAIKRA